MVRKNAARSLVVLLALVACQSPPSGPAKTRTPTGPVLSARELLTRTSLDLRGIRPSVAELQQVEASPEALDEVIAGFLDDARFAGRVRELFAPVYRTRIDQYPVSVTAYGREDEAAFQTAVGDEPLQLLSHLAVNDLPYTDLVTADYTMANEVLGAVWPLDYPRGQTGWRQAKYTDGRPMSGLLSTNAFYWRYPSNGSNYNRGRANNISRILLCQDHLERPVDFPRDIDLSDPAVVLHATRTNTGCVNCHVSIDPMGSYLFGFQYAGYGAPDLTRYHPDRELLWRSTTGVAPGFYGRAGYSIRDLGRQIAADPRFVQCAVQRVFEGLLRRKATLDDTDALTHHREVFLASGLKLKPLIASVLQDARYRGGVSEEEGFVPRKLITPDLLASQVEAITGYRWTQSQRDMLATDATGLRSLAGGADGQGGGEPGQSPNVTILLVQERLAEAASWAVVNADRALAAPEARRLFTEVSFIPNEDEGAIARQLQSLHRRIFGTQVALDGEEVAAGLELYRQLMALDHDPRAAWAGVLSALLRDPDFVSY